MAESIIEKLNGAFKLLSTEMKDWYPVIETLDAPPDSLSFHRKYVSQNRPVVIRNIVTHWPALTRWSEKYFRDTIGDAMVTVAVTPNGYADAIYKGKFVMPEERKICMSEFLDVLFSPEEERKTKGVFYIQKQNSNLNDEFSTLMKDVDPHIRFGTEAFDMYLTAIERWEKRDINALLDAWPDAVNLFIALLGAEPDAVNFWMGDERAVTSMHRDHYENLYCVVSGQKTFTLLSPTDLPFIPYESCNSAVYKENTEGSFDIVDVDEDGGGNNKVSWIAVDPLNPDLDRYPQYAHARPLTVTVNAGETLYLPSLWFHHVQQSHGCIAINYWYDMEFDIKWAYYKFLETISSSQQL